MKKSFVLIGALSIFSLVGCEETKSVDWWLEHHEESLGNDSNLLIVFYIQIMPDDFVMQLHRF